MPLPITTSVFLTAFLLIAYGTATSRLVALILGIVALVNEAIRLWAIRPPNGAYTIPPAPRGRTPYARSPEEEFVDAS